ncbi:M15 family metallopeptidase [Candidatus Saccharibacteria bacterium]|nr:M15 family metallopeptidase [Candidatus Saccharibacteria bacterium]
MKRLKLLTILLFLLVVVAAVVFARQRDENSSNPNSRSGGDSGQQQSPFDKTLYPTDEAGSLWIVVNKGRILPSTYVPANLVVPNVPLRLSSENPEMHLRQDAASALEKMAADAKTDGMNLMLASGYRSYAEQVAVYNGFVKSDGKVAADASSARPGHSEHQTGLAADLEPASRKCEVETCFESTPEGKWLASNSYKYGFIIRYHKDTQSLTGYEYEPWHMRYVGDSLSAQLKNDSQTLEQFFGLPTYPDYPAQMVQLK